MMNWYPIEEEEVHVTLYLPVYCVHLYSQLLLVLGLR